MRHENPVTLQSTYLEFAGASAPDVAPSGRARLWFDQANNLLKFSVNGGAYSENPGGLSLQDLSAHVLTTAPVASAASAALQLDSGTFAGSAAGTVLGINLGTGTADLINAQKAGVARFSVTETGIMTTLKGIIGGTTELANLSVFSTGIAVKGLVIQNVASQTANTFELQNSSAGRMLSFGGVGSTASQYFEVTSAAFGIFYNGRVGNNYRFGVTADGATSIPCALRAHASQSANIFETLNSSSVVQFAINAAHSLRFLTAPTADATLAKLLFGTTGVLVGGNAAGTYLGINAASGYAGDYLCFQANGATPLFQVTGAGRMGVGAPVSTYRLQVSGDADTILDGSISATNINNGTTAAAIVTVASGNGANLATGYVGAFNSAYNGIGALANRVVLAANSDAAGIVLYTSTASNDIRFYPGSSTLGYTFAAALMTLGDAVNVAVGTTTGTQWGTVGGAAGQKQSWWGAAAVVQPVLATGSTTDQLITVLQTLGLIRQS